MMKKRYLCIGMIAVCLCVLGVAVGIAVRTSHPLEKAETKVGFDQDILTSMQNGLEDETLKEYYRQDIEDAMESTTAKSIDIRYVNFDLNEDGLEDKIVVIKSPLHSGSHGDSLDILQKNQDGTYTNLSGLIVPLYDQSTGDFGAEMFVSENQTNGYHDIVITGDDTITLSFSDGGYGIK